MRHTLRDARPDHAERHGELVDQLREIDQRIRERDAALATARDQAPRRN